RARHHFCDALAGLLFLRRTRRALLKLGRALAIGATAAECRTFGEDFAVVLVVAARPIVPGFAARVLLPVGAAFGPTAVARAIATGAIEFRAVIARTRKPRTLVATTVIARSVVMRFVKP